MTRTLSVDAQARARDFILTRGRPLEQARYQYHFEGGHVDAVLEELARFQNEDGGMGHALEPDMRLPASSALATSVGLSILHEIQAPIDSLVVQEALRYVRESYDATQQRWLLVPNHDNDFPHAPWWHDDGELSTRFGHYLANPRAEIVGYLFSYASLLPAGFPSQLAEAIVAHLASYTDTIGMHDLLCYVTTIDNPDLPDQYRQAMLPRLQRAMLDTVVVDPTQWEAYTPKPLSFIHTPYAVFADLMLAGVQANLDYLVEGQQADGAWYPNWSWGDAYADVWPQVQDEWAGVLTLIALRQLRAFGRLAER